MSFRPRIAAGIAGVCALAIAGAAAAQVTDNASVSVSAKLVESLSIAGEDALDFGGATTPTAPATITISPAGTRSTNSGGGLTLLNTAGNTGQPATFGLSANAGEPVDLSFAFLNGASGYGLNDYRVSGCSAASETATQITLSGTGIQVCTLNVGATLSVPSGASGVVDVGDLQVTVEYN